MTIKTFTFNPFQENTYLVFDETNEAVIIDAGCLQAAGKQALSRFIEDNKLTLKRVLNTHLHLDHQFGNKFLFDTADPLWAQHLVDSRETQRIRRQVEQARLHGRLEGRLVHFHDVSATGLDDGQRLLLPLVPELAHVHHRLLRG